jgi:DNA gyrase subunit B
MKYLADNGHLYIAEPPLFKVKRGKTEKYLKNEAAYDEFIFEAAQNNIAITASGRKTALQGKALMELLKRIARYERVLTRTERLGRDRNIVGTLAGLALVTAATLKTKASAEKLAQSVRKAAAEEFPDIGEIKAGVTEDAEGESSTIEFSTRRSGVTILTTVDTEFVEGQEFAEICAVLKALKEAGEAPFTVTNEAEEMLVPDYKGLMEYVLEVGKKGLSIQRYKGLGEMNPEQLWETTMDPEKRTLLQVKIDDEVEADIVFTKLMGDAVEPRRAFIEAHALEATNVDI